MPQKGLTDPHETVVWSNDLSKDRTRYSVNILEHVRFLVTCRRRGGTEVQCRLTSLSVHPVQKETRVPVMNDVSGKVVRVGEVKFQRTIPDCPLLISWLEMGRVKNTVICICAVGYACTLF